MDSERQRQSAKEHGRTADSDGCKADSERQRQSAKGQGTRDVSDNPPRNKGRKRQSAKGQGTRDVSDNLPSWRRGDGIVGRVDDVDCAYCRDSKR